MALINESRCKVLIDSSSNIVDIFPLSIVIQSTARSNEQPGVKYQQLKVHLPTMVARVRTMKNTAKTISAAS